YAEQDTELYWASLLSVLEKLREHNPALFKCIEGLGVTAQRDTMVCLDENGKPLRNAIIWLDQRKADIVYRPGFPLRQVYAAVGMIDTIKKIQRDGKSNWIRQHQPEIWKKTYKYTTISGFFHRRMTGLWHDSTANQIGHIPFDYRRQMWSAPSGLSAKLYPIPKEKLPDLVPPGSIIGKISTAFAHQSGLPEGLSVVACGSDKGCETLGMGVVSPDTASLSFGTTATIQTTTATYVEPLRFLPAYPAPIPGKFNPEVEIFRGFWMITWFKEQFGFKELSESKQLGKTPEELLDETLKTVPAGSMGLLVQPYWSPGIKQPFAKGAMVGFGSVHTREYMYRALVEGLCYALLEGKHRIEKVTKEPIKRITVSGGASRSDAICRIAADVFGLPLLRGKTAETSGLGAAVVVQTGIGTYKTVKEAAEGMISHQDEFIPESSNHKLYQELFAVYQKIFPSLDHVYKKIGKITDYPKL
nr:FGGY-family carbohydrate kinase [Spirochaetales bacterium]